VKKLRKDVVNEKNITMKNNMQINLGSQKPFYDVRDAALNDGVNAYTSNLANKDNKNFVIGFKKKEGIK
jgi:hypothetical protein